MENNNKTALYIFGAFVCICIGYALLRSDDLKRNGIIVKGKILSYVFATKSSVMQFEFEFTYNGKTYKNSSPAGVTNATEFIGKTFPTRFSLKTEKSEILITPRHFKRYGMQYPDSLAWVRKYLIETF